MVAERSLGRVRAAGQPLDNLEITADRQYFLSTTPAAMAEDQHEPQSVPWSACAAEGVSSDSQWDQSKEIQELRQEIQDLARVLEAVSLAQSQPPERNGWSSDQWKSLKTHWWDDTGWNSSSGTASHSLPPRKWDTTEPASFPGLAARSWKRNAPPGRETRKKGHELSGLDGAGFCGRENLRNCPHAARR